MFRVQSQITIPTKNLENGTTLKRRWIEVNTQDDPNIEIIA